MTSRATALPLTETDVERLSRRLDEPSWLTERRVTAFRAYEAMAMPDPRAEEWRRTDISGLDLETALGAQIDAFAHWQAENGAPNIMARTLPPDFFFGSLNEGLKSHEAEIKEHLHSLVLPSEWKLGALQAALWQNGAFIYIPRNAEIQVPLEYLHQLQSGSLFPHLLVIAGENSSVTIVQEGTSPDGADQTLVSGVVEIFAGADSRVRFIDLQRWGDNVYNFSTMRAHLERGATLSASLVGLGGRVSKAKFDINMVGEGSSAELFGLTYGSGSRHFDYQTLQDHHGPHTVSDLLIKSALDDASSNVWYGTVRIHKNASQSEASQTSRNLLLSDHAKAAPIPVLEIEAFDVLRCSHGASAGPVDPEQLFYLESRGIAPDEAEALLIEAFFQEVVDRMPDIMRRDRSFRDELMREITARIGAAR